MTEKPEPGGVVTVAELLAKHGQSSGTGGRAHRRRAREGGITVAELTGEIPVVRDESDDDPATEAPEAEAPETETPETETPAATQPMALESQSAESQPAEPEPEEAAAPQAEAYSLSAVADAGPQSPREFASATDSPVMTPLAGSIMSAEAAESAAGEYRPPAESPAEPPAEPAAEKGAARQWLALAAQAVIGVAVGAALFVGFEKLWDALPYVALVLAILVILAMVAVVRILRKTDDTVSMLIAVVVGVIVTIGPLAFVLSTS